MNPRASDDPVGQFIHRRAAERQDDQAHPKPERPVLTPAARMRLRLVSGLAVGLGAGLVFGLVSQVINRLMLVNLPLFQAPLGFAGNLALYMVLGTVFGWAATWEEKTQRYLLFGLVGALLLAVFWARILQGSGSIIARLIDFVSSGFFTLGAVVLLVLLLLPFMLLVSWAITMQIELFDQPWWFWKRLLPALLALLAAGLAGALAIYSPYERDAVKQMNALVERGLAAQHPEELPAAFRYMTGPAFTRYAKADAGPYQLMVDRDVQASSLLKGSWVKISDPLSAAKFANGYYLVCRFPKDTGVQCRSDWTPPGED